MQREIVKFSADAAQTVRLDFSEGKEVLTKAGSKQWQYTVNRDSSIMWLPLAGKQAIERSGARAGDEVRICKSFLNQETIWTAQVVRPVAPDPPARQNGKGKVHGFPPAAYHQPEGDAAPSAVVNPSQARKPAEPTKPVSSPASHIAACLRQAIDAAIDAQEYGRGRGFSVTFLGSDVRAIANSLMIGDDKREGRR